MAQMTRTIPPHTYDFAPDGYPHDSRDVRACDCPRAFLYLHVRISISGLRCILGWIHCAGVSEVPRRWRCWRRWAPPLIGASRWHSSCQIIPTVDAASQMVVLRGCASAAHVAVAAGACLSSHWASDERDSAGHIAYRPVYVHAKVAIVDDTWWTVGSANLNSRGLHSDAEINVSVLDAITAHDLRLRLWLEHLQPASAERATLEMPSAGLAAMRASAQANLERVRRGEPLVGHMLPYVADEEAQRLGLPFSPEHGWLDNLEGGAGALPSHYAHRYL